MRLLLFKRVFDRDSSNRLLNEFGPKVEMNSAPKSLSERFREII